MHMHLTFLRTPEKKILILCHVTADTPVTLVTSGKPQSEVQSFKILKILKSHVAGLGLSSSVFT
jgi:hypothetical protein